MPFKIEWSFLLLNVALLFCISGKGIFIFTVEGTLSLF